MGMRVQTPDGWMEYVEVQPLVSLDDLSRGRPVLRSMDSVFSAHEKDVWHGFDHREDLVNKKHKGKRK